MKKLTKEELKLLKPNLEIIDLSINRKGKIKIEYIDIRFDTYYIYYLEEKYNKVFLKRYDFWLS